MDLRSSSISSCAIAVTEQQKAANKIKSFVFINLIFWLSNHLRNNRHAADCIIYTTRHNLEEVVKQEQSYEIVFNHASILQTFSRQANEHHITARNKNILTITCNR